MSTAPKAREGIYRRISLRMYGDERFMRLSPLQPSGQALWLYLLTGPHTGPIPGVFVAGRAALAEALGWELEAFDIHLAELTVEGLVEFDKTSRLWFIPNALKHNMPQNPNVVTSWRNQWTLLPECAMRVRIQSAIAEVLHNLSEAFGRSFDAASGKAFAKALPKHLGNDCPNQDTDSRKQETGSKGREERTTTPSTTSAHEREATPLQVCTSDMTAHCTRGTGSTDVEGSAIAPTQADGHKPPVKRTPAISSFEPPSWIDPALWSAYLEVRRKKRSGNGALALGLIIRSLEQFQSAGHDPISILENSVSNGWTGVFEPRAPAPIARTSGHSGFEQKNYREGVSKDGSLV